jgi:thymidylate synthase (FAD)
MRVIAPSFEILDLTCREDGVKLLRRVEYLARISHRSEEKQTADSWERVLQSAVMQKGDWSVTEHCTVTVIARVDRGVTHEWVRHRIGSYTQESTRFVNYGNKEIEFIKPSFIGEDIVAAAAAWNATMYEAEQSYKEQLQMGQPPQIARSVLPSATASTIAVTYNLRNWRFFFMSRDTRETHPDFRRVTDKLLSEFKRLIPILYDDLEVGQKQSVSFSRPR